MSGFDSTAMFTLRRRMSIGQLVALELGTQVLSIAVMVVWALAYPTVWALVVGGAVRPLLQTLGSHLLRVGYRNRFAWDAQAAREIREFGRWIVGSSAIHFFGTQGDRLLLGHYLGAATLGIYSIAAYLAEAMGTVVLRVTHGVLYPMFSRVGREVDRDGIREVFYQSRLRLDPAYMIGLGAIIVLGPWLVQLLWDDRYADAGWMLQILCVRGVAGCMLAPCDRCLLALGESRAIFQRSVFRTVTLLGGMPLGWWAAGLPGLLWVATLSEFSGFFALWPRFHRRGLLWLSRELLAVAFLGVGLALGVVAQAWLTS
jgi:O-antigen/teichoic acid export membrane protein